jgi:hypothetical protein
MERRRFLSSLTAASVILAGCSGTGDGTDTSPTENPTSQATDIPTQTQTTESTDTPTRTESPPETETPTDTETPTEASTPTAADYEVQSFSGSGQTVNEGIEIQGGLTVARATHEGARDNFIVQLVPEDGDFESLLVNAIGEYQGETAAIIEEGSYILDVDAGGDWTVDILQPRSNGGDSLPISISGNRSRVYGPYEFNGTHVANGTHSGDGNFIVEVYPQQGFQELVFNEIGQFDGETTFRFGEVGWIAVEANGDWTLDIQSA